MKLMKQDYRSEMDSVRAFANETLLKANGTQDKLRFGTAYQAYLSFCQQEGRTEPEKKGDFKKGLKDLGFKIENSKKDGNQVYIFNAKLVEVNE
jgi:phage/plasmid-associated DNA primase